MGLTYREMKITYRGQPRFTLDDGIQLDQRTALSTRTLPRINSRFRVTVKITDGYVWRYGDWCWGSDTVELEYMEPKTIARQPARKAFSVPTAESTDRSKHKTVCHTGKSNFKWMNYLRFSSSAQKKKWDHDAIILFDDCIFEAASGRHQLFKFYRLSPDFMD